MSFGIVRLSIDLHTDNFCVLGLGKCSVQFFDSNCNWNMSQNDGDVKEHISFHLAFMHANLDEEEEMRKKNFNVIVELK